MIEHWSWRVKVIFSQKSRTAGSRRFTAWMREAVWFRCAYVTQPKDVAVPSCRSDLVEVGPAKVPLSDQRSKLFFFGWPSALCFRLCSFIWRWSADEHRSHLDVKITEVFSLSLDLFSWIVIYTHTLPPLAMLMTHGWDLGWPLKKQINHFSISPHWILFPSTIITQAVVIDDTTAFKWTFQSFCSPPPQFASTVMTVPLARSSCPLTWVGLKCGNAEFDTDSSKNVVVLLWEAEKIIGGSLLPARHLHLIFL